MEEVAQPMVSESGYAEGEVSMLEKVIQQKKPGKYTRVSNRLKILQF